MGERLQKLMSQWGIASRRKAEQMILDGRVRLNGRLATLGEKADPDIDLIEVDGSSITSHNAPELLYILIHKPKGVVSTCQDPQNRRTILDLLPKALVEGTGIHPVGRLDTNSTGALLLTNHGATTFMLTHPRHTVEKHYRVWVDGEPSQKALQQWRQGVMLSGKRTLPAEISVLQYRNHQSLLSVVLREGRNRQIRRVAELLGHPVVNLHRISVGPIQLGSLPRGQYRTLLPSEIDFLNKQVQEFGALSLAKPSSVTSVATSSVNQATRPMRLKGD